MLYFETKMDFVEKPVPNIFKIIIKKCWEITDFKNFEKYRDFKRIKAGEIVDILSHPDDLKFLDFEKEKEEKEEKRDHQPAILTMLKLSFLWIFYLCLMFIGVSVGIFVYFYFFGVLCQEDISEQLARNSKYSKYEYDGLEKLSYVDDHKSDSVKIITSFEANANTRPSKAKDLVLKYDSDCKYKNIQSFIEHNWLYVRLWFGKDFVGNIFVSKRQIDKVLKYVDVVKMEDNITAWIDRDNYRYVNVPDYLKHDNCKLIRHAHRIEPTSMLFKIFQKPTNFTVYLLAPGRNTAIDTNSGWRKGYKELFYRNLGFVDEGIYTRGDGAFRKHFTTDFQNNQNWNKNWSLVTTDTSQPGFSRTAVDKIYINRIREIRRELNIRCDEYLIKTGGFCDCFFRELKLNIGNKNSYEREDKRYKWFDYGQMPNGTVQFNYGDEKDKFDCKIDYLDKYDIFKKDFVNEKEVFLMPYSFTWMGGIVFCEN